MVWWQTAESAATAAAFLSIISFLVQRRSGKRRLYDFFNSSAMSWVLPAITLAGIARQLDWHSAAVRDFILGWAALCVLVFALWGYGRLLSFRRVHRHLWCANAVSTVSRGPFQGWNPVVVRRSAISLVVFIIAGVSAGLLIEEGAEIAGGVAAAIALLAAPQVLATALALLVTRHLSETPAARQT